MKKLLLLGKEKGKRKRGQNHFVNIIHNEMTTVNAIVIVSDTF